MPKTLLLVDGSSYLYRAYHALPDLRTKDGAPTGALYGVINMLKRLRKDVPADAAVCVFDAKGKTFRDALYPQYKAHRPPMPDDLAAQIEPLHQAVVALGWPLLMVEGVEADDVIGTLVRQAEAQGMQSVVSTGDKDLAQLVNPNVTLINTMTNETLDESGVLAKFGVPADRIVDYLALVGDTVDNIPGVEKVGPKTAVKWLNQYGSLDGVIDHAEEIKGVVGDNLRRALDFLPLGRELVTVKTDVSLPTAPQDMHWQPEATDVLARLYKHYEFRAWLGELGSGNSPGGERVEATDRAQTEDIARDYETILDEDALQHWIHRLQTADLVSIDTETTSLDAMQARLVGLSISIRAGAAAYVPLAHHYAGAPRQLALEAVLAKLKPWLEDPVKKKLGQNLKYDWHVFANHGIHMHGIAHDTMLQSYVLEAHKTHNMDDLAERHLGVKTTTYESVCGKGAKQIGFDQVDVQLACEYAAEDADITLRLHDKLQPRIKASSGLEYVYSHIEIPLLPVLANMERHGVKLDCKLLRQHSAYLATEMLELEKQAHAAAGQPFNLNSTKQLQEILFDQLQLPVLKKTPKGAPSTDEDVLQKLALDYPLPNLILKYRGLAKLKSTYTDKLPEMVNPATGRIHTSYSQAVAVTGRLASQDPNLQNIPVRSAEGRKIREAFVAEDGFTIISADYSQIELRIMAHLSDDARLLEAFAKDLDIHSATAAEVLGLEPDKISFEQRRMAKAVNFGLIYGMSAFGLAGQLNIERATAQNFIDRYFARYTGVADYMSRTREQAKQNGYVETLFGRRLYLPEIRAGNVARRQGAERAAINAPMQGTAADLIKLAMIKVQTWLESRQIRSRMIMQVHDELVLEVPDTELDMVMEQLPHLMEDAAQLKVPLKVETGSGPNWEAAH